MDTTIIFKELKFKAVRSPGAGGQHVNKVSSKVIVFFDVMNSAGLRAQEKDQLRAKLGNRCSKDGMLLVHASTSRSQHRNKEEAIKKLMKILREGLLVPKKRRTTKPSKGAILKRIEKKKHLALKKHNRRKPDLD